MEPGEKNGGKNRKVKLKEWERLGKGFSKGCQRRDIPYPSG